MSEKSSVKSYEGFAPLILKLLQEISLATLMAQYASKVLGGNDPSDVRVAAREDVMSPKWTSSRDVNVKIYTIVPHPLHVEVGRLGVHCSECWYSVIIIYYLLFVVASCVAVR